MEYTGTSSRNQEDSHLELVIEYPLSRCSLQVQHDYNFVGEKVRRTPRPRQAKAESDALIEITDGAIASIAAAQVKAGPAALAKMDAARRFSTTEAVSRERSAAIRLVLGQRNGLNRVLQVLEQEDHIAVLNDRVREGVDIILALSANASAITNSDWPSTLSWLEKHLPLITVRHTEWLESTFVRHLEQARAIIAGRPLIHPSDYRTAPTPKDIADRLQITTRVLRIAQANRVGLTSIDPESKRDRDRRLAEERRRNLGVEPQSNRTKTAENKALGASVGVSGNTIQNWKNKGILDEKMAECRAKLDR